MIEPDAFPGQQDVQTAVAEPRRRCSANSRNRLRMPASSGRLDS